MKPKTIIAMLGVIALVLAFAVSAGAQTKEQKQAGEKNCMAQYKQTYCNHITTDGARKICNAKAVIFCEGGAFKANLEDVLEKHPGSIIASGQLLADGSTKTMAVSKVALPNLNIKVNASEISKEGVVKELAAEVNLVKQPVSKLVKYDKSAIASGGVIISTNALMQSTIGSGVPSACIGSDCCPVEDEVFLDPLGAEITESVFDFDALQIFAESLTEVIFGTVSVDTDGDGIVDAYDWSLLADQLDAIEWQEVFAALAEYLPTMEVLTDASFTDGLIEMRECYVAEDGQLRYTVITDPDEAGASFRKTLASDSAKEVAGTKEEVPPPMKCLVICDYDGNGACDPGIETDCNNCNAGMALNPCDLGVCLDGCYDAGAGVCLAPECHIQS